MTAVGSVLTSVEVRHPVICVRVNVELLEKQTTFVSEAKDIPYPHTKILTVF